jgi:hypothetical protein
MERATFRDVHHGEIDSLGVTLTTTMRQVMVHSRPSMTTRMCSTSPFIDTMAGTSTQLGKRVGSTRVVKTTVSVCESAGPRVIARALNGSRSNVNIPWPGKGMGDGEYLHAFQRVVMPIARAFDPELVISKLNQAEPEF